jgi:hypothetical protein
MVYAKMVHVNVGINGLVSIVAKKDVLLIVTIMVFVKTVAVNVIQVSPENIVN